MTLHPGMQRQELLNFTLEECKKRRILPMDCLCAKGGMFGSVTAYAETGIIMGVKMMKDNFGATHGDVENSICIITEPDLKEQIARDVLTALPDWFGIEESRNEYVENSRTQPFFACLRDGKYVGFIALKETGEYTAELCVMGVLKEYHRMGIGKKLFKAFYDYAKEHGYEYIQVKTVDAGHYEEYDRTRMFYESLGFRKLEVFPTLWDEWNPCLVMVMTTKEGNVNPK